MGSPRFMDAVGALSCYLVRVWGLLALGLCMLSCFPLSPGLLACQAIDFLLRRCCHRFAAGASHGTPLAAFTAL